MSARSRRSFVPFLALEGATLLAGLGAGVSMVAMPWLVLQLTGRPAAAGLVAGITALPMLLSSLASGTLIDRIGRRRTSVAADVFSALSAAAIPVVAMLGDLTFGTVLLLAVLGSVFDPAGVTAREAMLPDVSRAAGLSQQRVNAIHEAIWGLAYLAGPALGGLLIGVVGAVDALWVMFGGFVLSAALLALVHVPGSGRPLEEHRPQFWAGTVEGLRFVWDDRVLRAATIYSSIFVMLAYPVLGVVLPVVFEQQSSPQRLGLLLMAFSVGSVVGALAYGALGRRVSQRTALLLGMFGGALAIGWFAVSPPYSWLVVGAVVGGLLAGPINPVVNLVLQRRTPDQLRGRAMGVMVSVAYGIVPLGYLVAGIVVGAVGATTTMLAIALLGLVLVAVAARDHHLRGMDPEVRQEPVAVLQD